MAQQKKPPTPWRAWWFNETFTIPELKTKYHPAGERQSSCFFVLRLLMNVKKICHLQNRNFPAQFTI
jgi:hypothetical protein